MQYIKWVTIILVIGIMTIGVSGCMKKESIQEKMVDYMNKKYNDTFVYAEPFGGGAGATSKQIIVKSEKFPHAEIWVEYRNDNGKEIYSDNYVDYKFESQTRELILSLLNKAFNCEVILSFGVGSKGTMNDFTDKTSFEEYIGDNQSKLGFAAVVSNEYGALYKEKISNSIEELFINSGITIISGNIYFAQNIEQFKDINKIPMKILSSIPRLSLYMKEKGKIDSLEWR